MKELWSPSTGVLVVDRSGDKAPEILDAINGTADFDHHSLSCIDDWELIENELKDETLAALAQDYWTTRATSLAQVVLAGLAEDLSIRTISEIEEILQLHVKADVLSNHLLVAPLKAPEAAEKLALSASAHGFGATAYVFETVHSLQPLLLRLANTWLGLPQSLFEETATPPEIWRSLVRSELLLAMIQARDARAFDGCWFGLVKRAKPAEVSPLSRLFNTISESLYPRVAADPVLVERSIDEREFHNRSQDLRVKHDSRKVQFERALRQVDAIKSAVAQAKDDIARKYLKDLLKNQEKQYLVKSLCNIANHCADMFRTDFEHECLEYALRVNSDDFFTLSQWGDHLKRIGEYESAVKALKRASELSVNPTDLRVALTTLASVWVQKGDYAQAVAILQGIADWDSIPEVRTSLADILRRKGKLPEARAEYQKILLQWPESDRTLVGVAEIERLVGNYPEACRIYESLIQMTTDPRAKVVYSLGKCNVLKLSQRFEEAFQLADSVMQQSPFSMQARVQRAALLGLLDRGAEALDIIPPHAKKVAINEWLQPYVRGLLLLKLSRFDEARVQLIDKFPLTVLGKDNEARMRLGAAYMSICDKKIDEASKYLHGVECGNDFFAEYLCKILQLHIAAERHEAAVIEELMTQLASVCERDQTIRCAVAAIRDSLPFKALQLELELLLRAA
jgi:tetratricopeptide (TPR) repeat protein